MLNPIPMPKDPMYQDPTNKRLKSVYFKNVLGKIGSSKKSQKRPR